MLLHIDAMRVTREIMDRNANDVNLSTWLFDYLKPRFRIRVKISIRVGCRGRVRARGSIRFDLKVFLFFNPSLPSSELIRD